MWFLAPTVSLCAQQFSVLSSYIPAVGMKFLSGLDNVDKWRGRDLWDALLKNVRVVVSTYQILYDALSHGSVRLDNLALLIFDEGKILERYSILFLVNSQYIKLISIVRDLQKR